MKMQGYMWPPLPDRSAVSTVYTMPIVVWLSKPKPRDASSRGGHTHTNQSHKRGRCFPQSGDFSC